MDDKKTASSGAPARPAGGNRPGGPSRGPSRGPGGPGGARGGAAGGAGGGRGGPRRPGGGKFAGKPRERVKPEFDQKSLNVRRVTRVVAGGRRFSFSVAMVVGNRKGMVGVGTGKAADISAAMEKAAKNARKHAVKVKLTKTNSIKHEVWAKFASSEVILFPAPGRGIVAGSAVRIVLDLGGITDVTSKIHTRSKNKLNIAQAAIKALGNIRQTGQALEPVVLASVDETEEAPEVETLLKK